MIVDHVPPQRANMGQPRFLGFFEIAEHGAGGEDRRVVIGKPEPGGRFRLPLPCICSRAWCGVNCQPGRAVTALMPQRLRCFTATSCGRPEGNSGTRISAGRSRAISSSICPSRPVAATAVAGGKLDPGQRGPIAIGLGDGKRDGGQKFSARPFEQRVIGQRARRHQSNHVPPDQSLGGGRVFGICSQMATLCPAAIMRRR